MALALALVHPTYAVFLCLPLLGYVIARAVMARTEVLAGTAALLAVALPTAAVSLWLLPTVRTTVSHTPGFGELDRAFEQYPGQLDIFSDESYRLAPELFARSGAVAVVALALVPLAALAPLRRWAAFVLGGSVVVLGLTLTALLFPRFADVVSISQARRAAGLPHPFPFAFAGGVLLVARDSCGFRRRFLLRSRAESCSSFRVSRRLRLSPGRRRSADRDVDRRARRCGCTGSRGCHPLAGNRGAAERIAALAAALFVLPVAVHGIANWDPRPESGAHRLTPGLVRALRERVPERGVVFSDLETSYRIAAAAPVYVTAAPPAHVADTEKNRPYERREDVNRFLLSGNRAIPRRYGARYVVIDRGRFDTRLRGQELYRDGRFVLYRI